MDDNPPRDVCLFGLPGAGKGTLAKRIVEHYDIRYIQSGDIARRISKDSLETGALAPSQLFADEFEHELLQGFDEPILVDGFPRTVDQIPLALKFLRRPMFICLNTPPLECARRLLARGRQDDTPVHIAQRIQVQMGTLEDIERWIGGELVDIYTNAEEIAHRIGRWANWDRKEA